MFRFSFIQSSLYSALTVLAAFSSQPILADTLFSDLNIDGRTSSSVTVRQGISHSDFSWGISRSANDSRPLSHLDYQNLETETSAAEINISQLLQFRPAYWDISAALSYGKIQSGSLIDNDYGYNTEGQYLSTQTTASLKGSKNYGIALGAERLLNSSRDMSLKISVGFSIENDDFRQTNGYQTYSQGQALQSAMAIENLNSRYNAYWYGPFVGLAQSFSFGHNQFTFGSALKGHIYSAEGQWNLRQEFAQPKSFEHTALGAGFEFNANHVFSLTRSMNIEQHVGYDYNRTLNGTDTVFFADGTSTQTNLLPAAKAEFYYNIGFTWMM